ncbi:MAG TPA: type II secretion system F family protein [Falsiroseomonas sp.]|jgi:tight adherence protein B|nr:type II secretion system F family protein [Falsiroseomonas sp.]
MNLLFAICSVALLISALLLIYNRRDERMLRARMQGQASTRPAVRPVAEQNLIARPAARESRLAHISVWLGLVPGLLPLRAMPLPVLLVLSGVAGGCVTWGGSMAVSMPVAILLGAAGAAATLRAIFVWELGRHRQKAFLQIPDALGLMVRAVRAGLPVAEAVRSVAREMPDPTRSEFQRVIAETSIGGSLERALWGVHERTGLREYAFLSVVIGLQAQTGGGLAEALDNVADIVRRRVAMAAKARALAGQAKASAIILVALPPFAGAAVSLLNPGYLNSLFTDPRGNNLLAAAIVMTLMGIIVIRMMINRSTQE